MYERQVILSKTTFRSRKNVGRAGAYDRGRKKTGLETGIGFVPADPLLERQRGRKNPPEEELSTRNSVPSTKRYGKKKGNHVPRWGPITTRL